MADPFRAVQEEVSGNFSQIKDELAKWRKMPAKSPRKEEARQNILGMVQELLVDLQDMQATIDIALKDPAKFSLTPHELMSRQEFVRALQAQANDTRDLLSSTLPSRGHATPSASHIGMSTLRMEPQFMIVGHSMGVAAALAVRAAASSSQPVDVHRLDLSELHAALLADGQILERPRE